MINDTTQNETQRASGLNLDSPHVKSFATEAMLVRKMNEAGIRNGRYQVCRTPAGRWTAIVIGFRQELVGTGWPMLG